MKKKANQLPKGWTEARVRRLVKHYEGQSPEEAAAEDEDAYRSRKVSLIAVPVALLPEVRKLISGRKSA